ncbi:MAG: phage tail protein [Methylotenera sp.]
MQDRNNHVFDEIVNKGIALSKYKGSIAATKMMMKAGLPIIIIFRVLSNKLKRRSTDGS